MTRTTITPSNSNIVLPVPEKYIGKKIEVLMFDVEEVALESMTANFKLKSSQLRGFLSKDTAEALHQHLQQSRNEWDTCR
jgi:hypothetical protein